jgi:hypothetical protein
MNPPFLQVLSSRPHNGGELNGLKRASEAGGHRKNQMSGKKEKLLRKLQRLESAIMAAETPWYDRNLFWAPVGIAIGIVAGVIVFIYPSIVVFAALLFLALLCLSFAILIGVRSLISGTKARLALWSVGTVITALLLAMALLLSLGQIINPALTISVVGTDPLGSDFAVTNSSNYELSWHRLQAVPNLIVGNDGSAAIEGHNPDRTIEFKFDCGGFADSLGGNGDAQTYECLHNLSYSAGGIQCVDTDLRFYYKVADVPIEHTKEFRVVADRKDGFRWRLQPVKNPRDYCEQYLSAKARRELRR